MSTSKMNSSRKQSGSLSLRARKLLLRLTVVGSLIANLPALMPKASAQAPDLAQLIEATRGKLDPTRLPNPETAKGRLQQQIQSFEQYLGFSGEANKQDWLKFLKWDSLKEELGKETPDLRKLIEVELAFRQNYDGLEYAPFVDTRTAIDHLIRAQLYGVQPDRAIKAIDAQLEALQKSLTSTEPTSELRRSRDIGRVLNLLIKTDQGRDLTQAMQTSFAQPNVHVSASETYLNRVLMRPVQQGAPVDECILGTHVLGESCTVGSVTADLVPSSGSIGLCLKLGANFSSNNVGYNRGVKVYTTGYSPIHASKLINISPTGVSSQPATASADLQTSINGIEHRLKIVRKIASKQAAKQAPQANAIGEARLERRLASQFNEQVEQQLANSNSAELFNADRPVLRRIGIPAPVTQLSSSDQHVLANLREAATHQLAASARPTKPVSGEIVAEMHQSLPTNVAELFLGGRKVNSWEMDDLVKQFTGVVSPELQAESEGEPWSITFVEYHPVEVEFEDGLATISIRVNQMTRGDQELNDGITISATYAPVIEGGNLVFVRQGDVQLDFRGQGGIRIVTLRSFLKGKFEKFFKERSQPQSIAINDRFPNVPPLSLGTISMDDGWLQVGLQ